MATIYKPGDKDNTRQRTPVQARASAAALGVNHALGDPFAVELRHLLDQVMVLQQDGTVGAGGK
jgi:hypothetical protein